MDSDTGWGPHGPPSSWRNPPLRLVVPAASRRKTAQDFFAEWEQQDRDLGLRVYMDYKLNLGPLLTALENEAPERRLKDVLLNASYVSQESKKSFRLIEHLTVEQVRRVEYLVREGLQEEQTRQEEQQQ